MSTFNHVYTVAFSVRGSKSPSGDDITEAQLVLALYRRIVDLIDNNELEEAIGGPYDTYEEEEPTP